jgi:cytochrome c biogenesis protein CcdA
MFSIAIMALLAGMLSTLSPCVLPLLPIVVGSAMVEHRLGPLALAAGLAISFIVVGTFVASVGFAIGLDTDFFRAVGAVLIAGIGVVLMVPRLQAVFATAAGPVSSWTEGRFSGFGASGVRGQFGLGMILGVVWSPCVGPTLGAASLLAAQGRDLGQASLTMGMFGIGAALPLLLIGLASREALIRWRDKLTRIGSIGKSLLGFLLLLIGTAILTGIDRALESLLVEISPAWLTELTTRF